VASVCIAGAHFVGYSGRQRGANLPLHVIFTGLKETEASLWAAGQWARDLGGHLILLLAEVVPYPLPLDEPPVPAEFREKLLSRLATRQEVETQVKVFLCRDRNATLRRALQPNSIVVMGLKRWWRTREQWLAFLLRRDGHQVIVLDTGRLHMADQGVWKLGY
jgi:hypothetical protein